MRQNVSKQGKMVRLALAGALAVLTRRMRLPLWVQLGLTAIGVESFLAGATGFCPVNRVLGIDELRTQSAPTS